MKPIRLVLLLSVVFFLIPMAHAQSNDTIWVEDTLVLPMKIDIFTAMPFAVVYQDSAVHRLMVDYAQGIQRGEVEMPGWRVQIYSSNNQLAAKQEAENLKALLEKEIAEPVYVNFYQPFWKVRVGNFQTIEEARAYREKLLEQFPDLHSESYPVRDSITIIK